MTDEHERMEPVDDGTGIIRAIVAALVIDAILIYIGYLIWFKP